MRRFIDEVGVGDEVTASDWLDQLRACDSDMI